MVVDPSHRRQGVGFRMIAWGITSIDERGIESFIEAGSMGRKLYGTFGYWTVMKFSPFIPDDKDEIWNKYAHEFSMQEFYYMWRPKGGVIKDGERSRPWQLVEPIKP